jgi:hypothetical protein
VALQDLNKDSVIIIIIIIITKCIGRDVKHQIHADWRAIQIIHSRAYEDYSIVNCIFFFICAHFEEHSRYCT